MLGNDNRCLLHSLTRPAKPAGAFPPTHQRAAGPSDGAIAATHVCDCVYRILHGLHPKVVLLPAECQQALHVRRVVAGRRLPLRRRPLLLRLLRRLWALRRVLACRLRLRLRLRLRCADLLDRSVVVAQIHHVPDLVARLLAYPAQHRAHSVKPAKSCEGGVRVALYYCNYSYTLQSNRGTLRRLPGGTTCDPRMH